MIASPKWTSQAAGGDGDPATPRKGIWSKKCGQWASGAAGERSWQTAAQLAEDEAGWSQVVCGLCSILNSEQFDTENTKVIPVTGRNV